MKKIFKAGLPIMALTMFTFTSCNEESVVENVPKSSEVLSSRFAKGIGDNLENYNTKENRAAFASFSKDYQSMKEVFDITSKGFDQMELDGVDLSDMKRVIDYYKNCSDCHAGIKPVMIPLLTSLSTAKVNADVINVLNEYERALPNFNLAHEDEENVSLIISSFRYAADNSLGDENGNDIGIGIITEPSPQPVPYGWGNCMARNGGRALAEGMITGFVGGCIGGAIAGGTGGTVVLPGIGTVTGAVGGCIFGGAAGAVSGGALGLGLQGLKCLFRWKRSISFG